LIGRFDAAPTLLSKITTVVQIVFVLGELLRLSHWIEMPDSARNAAIVITAALTVASGLHYVVVWSARAWRTRPVAGRRQP
jgi:cardiolipin synthase